MVDGVQRRSGVATPLATSIETPTREVQKRLDRLMLVVEFGITTATSDAEVAQILDGLSGAQRSELRGALVARVRTQGLQAQRDVGRQLQEGGLDAGEDGIASTRRFVTLLGVLDKLGATSEAREVARTFAEGALADLSGHIDGHLAQLRALVQRDGLSMGLADAASCMEQVHRSLSLIAATKNYTEPLSPEHLAEMEDTTNVLGDLLTQIGDRDPSAGAILRQTTFWHWMLTAVLAILGFCAGMATLGPAGAAVGATAGAAVGAGLMYKSAREHASTLQRHELAYPLHLVHLTDAALRDLRAGAGLREADSMEPAGRPEAPDRRPGADPVQASVGGLTAPSAVGVGARRP